MALLAAESSPCSQESFTDPESMEVERYGVREVVGSRRMGLAVRAGAALLGVAALAGVGAASMRRTPQLSKTSASVKLYGAAVPAAMPQISPQLNDYFNSQIFGEPVNSLIPKDVKDDKNSCLENEELFEGLCYKMCALLTNGTHPYRSSAWTCCKEDPCVLEMPQHKVGLCSGFDVAGDGKSCPHQPGDCLTDEEMYLGMCYKKCSIITNGEKPYRFTPFTCCKTKGVECFSPSNSDSSFTMDKGGGKGDSDPATPKDVHFPIAALTEEGGSTGAAAAEVATPAVVATH